MAEYGASNIKVLKGLEAVRKRPGMYIGDTSIKGLHHLVYEVVDNSIDEAMAGFCDTIKVTLTKNGSAIIEDNGRGIPVALHPTEKISAATVVMTVLHAGGKFDKDTYKVSGGLHGVGVSVVNALSKDLKLTIFREGSIYEQNFKKGIPQETLVVTGNSRKKGTKIEFWADESIFTEGTSFQKEILMKRFKELAYLNPKIKIDFRDERDGSKEIYHFEGGIKQFVEDMNTKEALSTAQFFQGKADDIEIDIALMYCNADSEKSLSFVNNIKTADGGTHEAGFRAGLTRSMASYISKNANAKEKGTKITGEDCKEGLITIVSVRVPEPQFEGQTKGKLGSSYVRPLVQRFFSENFNKYLEENPIEAKAIMAQVLLAARGRDAAKRAKDLVKRKDSMSIGTLPGKLADCQSKDPSLSEIYLVEGDSAGGCFVGDTKIALADGRDISFLDLIEEYKAGKENFCYTIKEDGSIGLEKILYPRKTKSKATLIEVTLDNGENIRCTPEHKFMIRSGEYVEAKDLKEGQSLMPLLKKAHKHHRDFNKLNNKELIDSNLYIYNHKIVSVKKIEIKEDVYDIEVPNTHNFALASGVFVHNSAKQGRDRVFQAILPLKGKILNVEKARLEKILKSDEIKNMITALGCGIGDEFNEDKLRYHKVIIMTDADVDGSHIQTLLMTFFFRFLKPIIAKGYLYLAQPPLYRYKKGKNETYLKDDKALNDFLIENGIGVLESKTMGRQDLTELFKLVAYYKMTLTEIEKRFALPEVVRYMIENPDIISADNQNLSIIIEKYINGLGYNILSKTVNDELLHYFVQTNDGLEELIIDDNLFTSPYYNEAIYMYQKINDRITDEFKNKDILLLLNMIESSAKKGAYIQRYKGLGEMNPEQLWETTMNPEDRRLLKVVIDDDEIASDTFVLFMGDEVEPRRAYIETHAKDVKHLDV
jgi:DNA gyrase subunit B